MPWNGAYRQRDGEGCGGGAAFSAIKKEVGAGGKVKIFKFGTFSTASLTRKAAIREPE